MRVLIFPLLVAAALLAFVQVTALAQDRSDPQATARAVLTAFKARDLGALAELANANNRDLFDALAAEGRDHRAYDDVFSGWRAEAVDTWDGTLSPARVRGEETLVPFAMMADGEVAVLVLTNGDDGLAFEDINSPDAADLEALPLLP